MKVYLYKKYNDELAYGEEVTELYPTRDEAITKLKTDVKESHGIDLSGLRGNPEFAGDTLEDDHVEIHEDGNTVYFIVEEKEMDFSPSIIRIPLHDNVELVAGIDGDFNEIFISIHKDGIWHQDLVMAGEQYVITDDYKSLPLKDEYRVIVWSDCHDEQYMNLYKIPDYEKEV